MKTKPNEPINCPDGSYRECTKEHALTREGAGLTKREYFAALAMQGVIAALSSGEFFDSLHAGAVSLGIANEVMMARMAVDSADALIEALNKDGNKKDE